ncbi:hypothetical protein QR680_011270 [Steinernema hermaphroditum]|uniref:Uncharacterized protein n=1 Tax=Steinernema hermaphroditum TaxID=289476 RepID=A0AA39MCJ8_9BILA|nr:hypothetical protein QR680_011270 [Steinernema hermaphroditum]
MAQEASASNTEFEHLIAKCEPDTAAVLKVFLEKGPFNGSFRRQVSEIAAHLKEMVDEQGMTVNHPLPPLVELAEVIKKHILPGAQVAHIWFLALTTFSLYMDNRRTEKKRFLRSFNYDFLKVISCLKRLFKKVGLNLVHALFKDNLISLDESTSENDMAAALLNALEQRGVEENLLKPLGKQDPKQTLNKLQKEKQALRLFNYYRSNHHLNPSEFLSGDAWNLASSVIESMKGSKSPHLIKNDFVGNVFDLHRLIIKLSWKTRAVQAIKSEVENLCLSSENITNAADSFKMTGRYKNAQITFKSMLNFVSKAVKHGHGPPSESLETYHTRVKKILKDGNYSSWEHVNRLAITSKHGSVFLLRAYNTKKYQFSSCYTQKEFPYHDIEASIPGEA